jgi:nucleotide-binding universal stress UspA family protein
VVAAARRVGVDDIAASFASGSLATTDAMRGGHRHPRHPAKRAVLLRDSTDRYGGAERMKPGRAAHTVGRTNHPSQEAIVSTIVIGVDASASAEDAVAFGRRLAHASGSRVILACAFPYEEAGRAMPSQLRYDLRAKAQETADRLREGLTGIPDDRIEIRLVGRYSAAHALHDLAEAEGGAIVVVGSTHTGHAGRVCPGATGERLLHGSPCAVAVVPEGYRTWPEEPIRRVGVGTDGSRESLTAVAAAADLARGLGARLEVISVAPTESHSAPALTGGYHTLREDIERRQREGLQSAVGSLPAGTEAEAVALSGSAERALIGRSERLDMLILGSRGYGPLRSVMVGGVSGQVVRGARCPVIAIPRGVAAPLDALFTPTTAIA